MSSKNQIHEGLTTQDFLIVYLKAAWVGFFIGAVAWIGEALIHVYVFKTSNSIINEIVSSDLNEIWMRGFVLALFVLFSVITAHYHQEKNQLAIENKLAYLALGAIREGAMITDSNNKIVYLNDRFSEITGYQKGEVLGKNPNILSSGRQDKSVYQQLWRQLQSVHYWQGEIWNRRKNGEVYPEWLSISLVKDPVENMTYHVAVFTDITNRKETEERIIHYAYYDPLTSFPNRRYFMEQTNKSIQISQRDNQVFAVLFIDLDDFKKINDTHGHGAGDEYLSSIAKLLKSCLKDVDFVARIGGDEFSVLLPNIKSRENGLIIANDLIKSFKETTFSIEGHQLHAKASIGGAIYPDDGTAPATIMKKADEAMYRVKEKGGASALFYDETWT